MGRYDVTGMQQVKLDSTGHLQAFDSALSKIGKIGEGVKEGIQGAEDNAAWSAYNNKLDERYKVDQERKAKEFAERKRQHDENIALQRETLSAWEKAKQDAETARIARTTPFSEGNTTQQDVTAIRGRVDLDDPAGSTERRAQELIKQGFTADDAYIQADKEVKTELLNDKEAIKTRANEGNWLEEIASGVKGIRTKEGWKRAAKSLIPDIF